MNIHNVIFRDLNLNTKIKNKLHDIIITKEEETYNNHNMIIKIMKIKITHNQIMKKIMSNKMIIKLKITKIKMKITINQIMKKIKLVINISNQTMKKIMNKKMIIKMIITMIKIMIKLTNKMIIIKMKINLINQSMKKII